MKTIKIIYPNTFVFEKLTYTNSLINKISIGKNEQNIDIHNELIIQPIIKLSHDIVIDILNIEKDENINLDESIYKILRMEIMRKTNIIINYKFKTNKGFKKIFEKTKTTNKHLNLNDFYMYLKNLPNKQLFIHRFYYLVKDYLNAQAVLDSDVSTIFNSLLFIESIQTKTINIEDTELKKIVLNI